MLVMRGALALFLCLVVALALARCMDRPIGLGDTALVDECWS